MILGRLFLSEFIRRIAGGVDLSSETALGLPKGRGEVSQADDPDHQQVHVAECMFLIACHRTVDKGAVDARLKWLQRLLERGWARRSESRPNAARKVDHLP